jgi:hypothetical protein
LNRDLTGTRNLGKLRDLLRVRFVNRRLQILVLLFCVGITLFYVGRIPVRSDDGTGTEDIAFDSPVLIWKYPLGDKSLLVKEATKPGDLLTNGNMDQMGFYWRPPNHWIAGGWFEWFSAKPFNFPEFNDGFERGFSHTYPSSQRLQLWANDYAGGLMQSVTVTPCTYYEFEAYGHSRPGADNPPPLPVTSHMRIGIEPYGWMSGRPIYNYDPGLEPEEFPPTMVWSPEADNYFTYGPYRVVAEALSKTLTVALFSYPEVDIEGGVLWHDTLWDTASLVQVPPPSGTLLDGAEFPAPDRFISNVRTTLLPRAAIVEWETAGNASAQVLYRALNRTIPFSITEPLSHSVYFPMMTISVDPSTLLSHSSPDYESTRQHRVVLSGLPMGYALDYVVLSRRLDNKVCVTSASKPTRVILEDGGAVLHLPVVWKDEQ